MPKYEIHQGNNLDLMKSMIGCQEFSLIYTDPPFNTRKEQFLHEMHYEDSRDGYIEWLRPRIIAMRDLLTKNGSLFIHLDYREVHYVKVMCDQVFGRDSFMNEIIWMYDFGARQKTKWATKHDTILWYVNNPKDYVFKLDEVDLIDKKAPGLPVSKTRDIPRDKKRLSDCWWNSIVPTNGKERTGYPTQKPLALASRILRVHSNIGDRVLDPFAGSGTFGEASCAMNRTPVLIDENPQAIEVMQKRLSKFDKNP